MDVNLTLPAGSIVMGADSYIPSTSPNAADLLGVYYNGSNYFWTVGVSGSTGETITINNYDDGRLLTATAAADQIDAESNAKYTESDVWLFKILDLLKPN